MCRPPGRRARDADRVEGRLAPRLGEQHLLDRRDELDEPLRELDLDGETPTPMSPVVRAVAATAASTSGSLWPSSGRPNAAW
jgi:hypothetical protein